MILLIEPISRNIGMYVPTYPLPLMEIAGYIKAARPKQEIRIMHMPFDYGLPLTPEGKNRIYEKVTRDIAALNPTAVGISCTAISQAEEAIFLCDRIKKHDPGIFIFMGGYFPTIYHEEIFSRTNTVDLIVIGEGETPTLEIIDALEKGENPLVKKIPNLVWTENGKIKRSSEVIRFDLKNKRPVQSSLLKNPKAYDILPYAFSRGCPYQCHFCMEDAFRPTRKKVPTNIIKKELRDLKKKTDR